MPACVPPARSPVVNGLTDYNHPCQVGCCWLNLQLLAATPHTSGRRLLGGVPLGEAAVAPPGVAAWPGATHSHTSSFLVAVPPSGRHPDWALLSRLNLTCTACCSHQIMADILTVKEHIGRYEDVKVGEFTSFDHVFCLVKIGPLVGRR